MGNPFNNLAANFFQISAHSGAGGSRMAASTEFAANLVHVDAIVFRSHAQANSALRQLLKQYGDDDRVDAANIVDQAVDIIGLNSQALLGFVRESHARDPIVRVERGSGQNLAKELDSPLGIALVQFVRNPCGVDPAFDEFSHNLKSASIYVRVTERTGIRGDSSVQCVGSRLGERKIFGTKKFINDLAGRGRNRIDVDQITISGVTGVMIDVDPLSRASNRFKSRTQALQTGGIQGNGEIKLFRLVGRSMDDLRSSKKSKAHRQAILVPRANLLSQLP